MPLRVLPALAAALLSVPAQAAAPWDGAPFAAEPAAIRAAAEALPPAIGPVDVLLDEATWRLDARGAATTIRRVVFRVLSADAATQVARIQVPWAPWRQARPELRARVVAGAQVEELSPSAISESPLPDSELRALSASLPGLREGAIVEQVVTIRDEAPLFEAGVVERAALAGSAPARVVRVRIEAPASLPLRAVARGVSAAPREAVRGGVRTIELERRDVAAAPPREPAAPRDGASSPQLLFGWGRAWSDVAERYGALVDARIAGADLSAPLAAALGGARPGRDETVRRVMAWVRERVRVVPCGLGGAPLAPAPPAETLRRGEGKWQDVAALTVALLRAAGLDAHVALAATDDVPAELPGLGLLERPIVRVDGGAALWADPVDRWSAPGRVALAAEGKLALVVRRGTRELVRVPASQPKDNASATTREIRLAELGAGGIVETRTLTGALAASERALRASFPGGAATLDEHYAREIMRGMLVAAEVGGDEARGELRVRLEVDGSAGVQTSDDEAVVPVAPDALFEPLAASLPVTEDTAATPRAADLELALPYRAEIRYHVIPPDGFRARPLPPDREERFGAATLVQRSVLERDGSITVTFRFDTGGRHLAAKDADALVRRVREIVRADDPRVAFERTGAALLAAGRVREAIAEMRRLGALHPREALHPLHLAVALVGLGYTDAAVAEARRAIALEPGRAWAHRVLAWALEHDAVGRLHGPGFDRDGAIAEYRRAKELDPSHAGGRAALAALLARDARGDRGGEAELAAAIAEYRALREETHSRAYDGGLLAALFSAGKWADATALARQMPASSERDALLVASGALQDGVPRAETEAAALGDAGRDALANASALLASTRRHALAAKLAEAASRGSPNAAELRTRAETLAALRPWEQARNQGDEAERLLRRLLVLAVNARDPAKEIGALVSHRVPDGALREAIVQGLPLPTSARTARGDEAMPPDVLLDVALSTLEVAREGEPGHGLRLRVRFRFSPAGRGAAVYLVREGGALRVLATDRAWPALGAEIVRLAGAGDAAGAARWLAWAREDVPGLPGDPASPAGILAALARPGAPLDAAGARRAGAALLAWADDRGETLPLLAPAPGDDAAARLALALARTEAARAAKRPAAALAAADDALAQDPASRDAFAAKAWALRRLGRAAEVDRAADAVLAHRPDDPEVLGLLASSRLLSGDLDGAAHTFRRLIDAGRATPPIYNDAAWLELFRGGATPLALDWARRAVEGSPAGERASQNTLAALHAALGQAGEAREVFLRSIEGKDKLDPEDWYVFGRIAEAWGLDAAARAAYGRVEPSKVDGAPDPSGPHELAQRALARLGPAPVPASAPAPRP